MIQPAPSLLQSYWVIPGRFLAGEYPAHMDRPRAVERLDALLDVGIDSIFDLTEPDELEAYLPALASRAGLRGQAIHYQRFPILDFNLPKQDDMRDLLDAIDGALAGGRNIYVHCWGGIGRTGMAVGCYLVRHGQSGDQALSQIAAWRQSLSGIRFHPRSPETPEQAEFVRRWRESQDAAAE